MTPSQPPVTAGRRIRTLALVCSVLMVLVVLRQLGAGPRETSSRQGPSVARPPTQSFDVADFEWPADAPFAAGAGVERDPFRRGNTDAALTELSVARVASPASAPAPIEAAIDTPSTPPVPSDLERAQAELDAMRLMGVVVRQGKVFALLLQGEKFHTVALGDRLDQRFDVTALDASAIELLDPTTGARRRIGAPGP